MTVQQVPFKSQYGIEIDTVFATDPGFTETGGIVTTDTSIFNNDITLHGSMLVDADISAINITATNATISSTLNVSNGLNVVYVNANDIQTSSLSSGMFTTGTLDVNSSAVMQDVQATSLDVSTLISCADISSSSSISTMYVTSDSASITSLNVTDVAVNNTLIVSSDATFANAEFVDITSDTITSTAGHFTSLTSNTLAVNTDKFIVNSNGNTTVAGSLTISGDLVINGTSTSINSQTLSVTDPLIYLATGNSANANDIGIVGHFDNGTYQHTGFVRDATDGVWKLFSAVTQEPTSVIDFTGATYDPLKVGNITVNTLTAGSSTLNSLTVTTSTTLNTATIQSLTATSVTATSIVDSAGDIRLVPQNAKTSQYTLTQADSGKHISITSGGVIVPADTLSIGTTITIFNNSAFSQTIVQGSNVTMYMAGASSETTGNRTLTLRGLVTLMCVDTNKFVISGAGLL